LGEGLITPLRKKVSLRIVAQGLGFGPVAGLCENDKEPSDSIKDEELLD
jgi:hypothetical protein